MVNYKNPLINYKGMVEIKVDTLKNSKDDIKKVISFLQQFIESTEVPSVSEGAFNIFNQDTPIEPKSDKPDESEDTEIKPIFY